MPDSKADVIDVEATEDLVNRAVMVASIVKAVMATKSANAVQLDEILPKGDKRTAMYIDADGVEQKLGTVSKSFPEPVATITDQDALEAYLRETRAADLDVEYKLDDLPQVYAVLCEHAPELLTITEGVIPKWLIDTTKKEALIPGRTIPGITVTRPAGKISVRPNAAAQALADQLLQSSPLLAIEAPTQETRP
ncbi:hypothetical protein ABH922_003038 [Rhodococcus sp. 27YEA15]|uniref:hypothetical protein n=1 Tax=Rhodococcus sp. 27YEA15 TaxID=3156259 RepID=UPI003C79FAE4